MSTRPPSITFTDLSAPVYSEDARAIREGLAGYGATLTLTPSGAP